MRRIKSEDLRLYEVNTYDATPRLNALRAGTEYLTIDDLRELFEEFCDGQEGWGDGTRNVRLVDFGAWLLGNHDQNDIELIELLRHKPAEILW